MKKCIKCFELGDLEKMRRSVIMDIKIFFEILNAFKL